MTRKKIVSNFTYIAHTGPTFNELKLLKFYDIHSFQLGTLMFSFENSTLPSKFNNFFLLNSQIHNYNTRNAQSFRLPLCRTNTRKFSIYFQGPNFLSSFLYRPRVARTKVPIVPWITTHMNISPQFWTRLLINKSNCNFLVKRPGQNSIVFTFH